MVYLAAQAGVLHVLESCIQRAMRMYATPPNVLPPMLAERRRLERRRGITQEQAPGRSPRPPRSSLEVHTSRVATTDRGPEVSTAYELLQGGTRFRCRICGFPSTFYIDELQTRKAAADHITDECLGGARSV
ncbi:hypothetical protein [Nocardiopsis synnemataformans]|uniref:hypothetical protein n=1 Tax=Nocardiopsis synnemataformans TaxID=61305 RepID=UPI003EB94BB4